MAGKDGSGINLKLDENAAFQVGPRCHRLHSVCLFEDKRVAGIERMRERIGAQHEFADQIWIGAAAKQTVANDLYAFLRMFRKPAFLSGPRLS